ncbi:hypothetical protein LOAG_10188 [Loa loa]|uniref:Uncharacterized protein n=1 Tax=Loa loa TaxID=7209 RepID=A0A1S0TQX4_LOALO|nr:hypothetical protein LOAG_10188 [Loa loa]EFO18307.2 hypothetical protein LOAG_10188 [Loa loa]
MYSFIFSAVLSIETNAQAVAFNPVSFVNRMGVGEQLVAGRGNTIRTVTFDGSDRRTSQPSQPPQTPSNQGLNALQTALAGFLLGSVYGRGSPYYPSYGYYYPYFGYSPYSYGYFPYYYYYYG